MTDAVRLFLIVYFWGSVVGIVLRVFLMAISDYPRELSYSQGEDAVHLVVACGFLSWVSWLLWGQG